MADKDSSKKKIRSSLKAYWVISSIFSALSIIVPNLLSLLPLSESEAILIFVYLSLGMKVSHHLGRGV